MIWTISIDDKGPERILVLLGTLQTIRKALKGKTYQVCIIARKEKNYVPGLFAIMSCDHLGLQNIRFDGLDLVSLPKFTVQSARIIIIL